MSLEDLKQGYLRQITLKNFSALSIRQNEMALRFFIAWLEQNAIFSVHRVSAHTFERYKAELMGSRSQKTGTRLQSNTVRARLINIQLWFAWMRRKGFTSFNPMMGIRLPPLVRHLPRGVMSVQEIRAVMDQPDLKTLLGYRDRTMMEVLYSTGMRAAELLAIEVKDIDLTNRIARVRMGKGAKDRCVPLSTPSCHFLERYLRKIRPELAPGIQPAGNNWLKKYRTGGDTLFLTTYGGPMTRQWLAQTMQRHLAQAGITKVLSPVHSFRHSVATHLMESGMDVRYVQTFLGHSNINSTMIYTHVGHKPMNAKLGQYHPRAIHGDFKPYVAGEDHHA